MLIVTEYKDNRQSCQYDGLCCCHVDLYDCARREYLGSNAVFHIWAIWVREEERQRHQNSSETQFCGTAASLLSVLTPKPQLVKLSDWMWTRDSNPWPCEDSILKEGARKLSKLAIKSQDEKDYKKHRTKRRGRKVWAGERGCTFKYSGDGRPSWKLSIFYK